MDELNLIDTKNRKDMAPENPGPVLDPTHELVRQPKSAEVGIRARSNQFPDLESFAAWRRSKGFPDLSYWNLVWAWAQYRGEPVNEQAIAAPVVERR